MAIGLALGLTSTLHAETSLGVEALAPALFADSAVPVLFGSFALRSAEGPSLEIEAYDLYQAPVIALPDPWLQVIGEGVRGGVGGTGAYARELAKRDEAKLKSISETFLSSPPVPEPGSAFLIGTMGVILLMRHRRRLP